MTFKPGHVPAPKRRDVIDWQPGDSSMLRMLKLVKWALMRGKPFKARDVINRFGCTRSTAYAYVKEWRHVFGDKPPTRRSWSEPPVATLNPMPAPITLADLMSPRAPKE